MGTGRATFASLFFDILVKFSGIKEQPIVPVEIWIC